MTSWSLDAYAAAKHLPADYLRDTWGVHDGTWCGRPAVIIPWRDEQGITFRERVRLAPDENGEKQERWGAVGPAYVDAEGRGYKHYNGATKGVDNALLPPYGCDLVAPDTPYVIVGEGESDAQACHLMGMPFLGVAGASCYTTTVERFISNYLGSPPLYVIDEGDQGAKTLQESVAKLHGTDFKLISCRGVTFPDGTPCKDPSDVLLASGTTELAADRMADLLAQAVPYDDDRPSWFVLEDAASYIDKPIEPPDALIDGVLCRRHVMLMCANAGVGKSYILAYSGLMVSTGGEWFGHKCHVGRVLMVNPEEQATDYRVRIREVAKAMGVDVAPLLTGGRLMTITTRGHFVGFSELVATLAKSGERFDLICLDSINALLEDDENSSIAVRKLFITANELAEATGASVLMIHHISSKAAPGKIARGARARGSSAFLDAPDVYAELVPLDVPPESGGGELLSRYHNYDRGAPIWATAHRLQFCKMRRFPRPDDLDLIWQWPRFVPDPTAGALHRGELAEYAIVGSKKAAGKRGGEEKARKSAERWEEQDAALGNIVEGLRAEGITPTLRTCLEKFNDARADLGLKPVSSDALRRYTAKGGKLTWRRRSKSPYDFYIPDDGAASTTDHLAGMEDAGDA